MEKSEQIYLVSISYKIFNLNPGCDYLSSILNVSFENLTRALNQVKHPCRLEWIHPRILIDGSHNLEGWSKLKDYLVQMDLMQNSQWVVCLKRQNLLLNLAISSIRIHYVLTPETQVFTLLKN